MARVGHGFILILSLMTFFSPLCAQDFEITLSQGTPPQDNALSTERDTDLNQTIRVGDNEEGSFSFSTLIPLTTYALSGGFQSELEKNSSSLTNPTVDSTTPITSYTGSIPKSTQDASPIPTTVSSTVYTGSMSGAKAMTGLSSNIPADNASLGPRVPVIPASTRQSSEKATISATANAASFEYKEAVSGFKVRPHAVNNKVHLDIYWQRAEVNGQISLAKGNLQSTVTLPLGEWIMVFGKKARKNVTTISRTVSSSSSQIWLKIDRVDDENLD